MEERNYISNLISACGANCSECDAFKLCGGCKNSQGKVFYLKGAVCPLFQCASDKACKDCGGCNIKQCKKFMSHKDSRMTDEEFEKWVDIKIANLKKNGKKD